MLEFLFSTMQWSVIAGIWVFTIVGFYQSYKELKRVFGRAHPQNSVHKLSIASVQPEPAEWQIAA